MATDPRAAALATLRAVRAGTPFAAALDAAARELADRDRRLAHEISAGVLRARSGLDHRLRPLVRGGWRRLAPDLKDVLRIGAYQLHHLARVPPYAAVETAVDLARDAAGAGAAALVNAVLRRVAGQGSEVEAQAPGNPPQGLGVRYSHPAWLVARWLRHFGRERTEALLAHHNRRPALVIQPVRWGPERLATALAAAGVEFEPAPRNLGFLIRGRAVRDLPGYSEGGFVVQDPAQALVLRFAALPDGALVWDACAAPGGKTRVLSERCRVRASDARRARLEPLRHPEAGLPRFVADARHAPLRDGSIDAVLLDVPCSATGTFARHPDARWRLTPRRIAALAQLQGAMLDAVAPVPQPGGILIYSTCSLEPEENEQQVNGFLRRHPEYRRATTDLSVFPTDLGGDGAYAAKLERRR